MYAEAATGGQWLEFTNKEMNQLDFYTSPDLSRSATFSVDESLRRMTIVRLIVLITAGIAEGLQEGGRHSQFPNGFLLNYPFCGAFAAACLKLSKFACIFVIKVFQLFPL